MSIQQANAVKNKLKASLRPELHASCEVALGDGGFHVIVEIPKGQPEISLNGQKIDGVSVDVIELPWDV